jgi:S-adenosylmethionine/arginine decarboxylase-like enzyme
MSIREVVGRPLTEEDTRGAFGMQLLIDLADCNPETIRSKRELRRFARELCEVIDMQRYRGPIFAGAVQALLMRFARTVRAKRFALDNPHAGGYTVVSSWLVQLIYTSNVTGHLVEANNTACFDVFSCKPFSPDAATAFVMRFFGARQVDARVVIRGRRSEDKA